jgi:hypothetical protein
MPQPLPLLPPAAAVPRPLNDDVMLRAPPPLASDQSKSLERSLESRMHQIFQTPKNIFGLFQRYFSDTLMSLVLVYAGIPTIFANFRTFIQLYLIIFDRYIAVLHRNPTSHLYIALYIAVLRRNPTSHLYIALLGHATSHYITL